MPQSNDALRPRPFVPVDGPAIELDFPGLSIGVAEYAEGPTGGIVDRDGRVVRGFLDPDADRRLSLDECLARAAGQVTEPPPGNTTLTVLVTNQRLPYRELTQLGRQVHASMARAIQPFHGLNDGDVLFAVSTAEVDSPELPSTTLGALASELAWDAVLSAPPAGRSDADRAGRRL